MHNRNPSLPGMTLTPENTTASEVLENVPQSWRYFCWSGHWETGNVSLRPLCLGDPMGLLGKNRCPCVPFPSGAWTLFLSVLRPVLVQLSRNDAAGSGERNGVHPRPCSPCCFYHYQQIKISSSRALEARPKTAGSPTSSTGRLTARLRK